MRQRGRRVTTIKAQVDSAKADAQSALSAPQRLGFKLLYQALLANGFKANPLPTIAADAPKKRGRTKQSLGKNLLDRLNRHEAAVLAFKDISVKDSLLIAPMLPVKINKKAMRDSNRIPIQ